MSHLQRNFIPMISSVRQTPGELAASAWKVESRIGALSRARFQGSPMPSGEIREPQVDVTKSISPRHPLWWTIIRAFAVLGNWMRSYLRAIQQAAER